MLVVGQVVGGKPREAAVLIYVLRSARTICLGLTWILPNPSVVATCLRADWDFFTVSHYLSVIIIHNLIVDA